MKKVKIIITIILLAILVCNCTFTLATINPNDYKPNVSEGDAGGAIPLAQRIITTITIVGTVIFVIVVMVLGIKYMLGSVEQKAEYKKDMIPILIGAMLLFGSSWIVQLIYNIVPKNISNITNSKVQVNKIKDPYTVTLEEK